MYCPHCEKHVIAKRQDFNLWLFLFLCLVTGGIGAIIYLAVWYNFDENRCIHCKAICQITREPPQNKEVIHSRSDTNRQQNLLERRSGNLVSTNIKLNFCPNCGAQVKKTQGNAPRFCPYCGENLIKRYSLESSKNCSVCHQPVNTTIQDSIHCSYCGTIYHHGCVANWHAEHNACPLCQNVFLVPESNIASK